MSISLKALEEGISLLQENVTRVRQANIYMVMASQFEEDLQGDTNKTPQAYMGALIMALKDTKDQTEVLLKALHDELPNQKKEQDNGPR